MKNKSIIIISIVLISAMAGFGSWYVKNKLNLRINNEISQDNEKKYIQNNIKPEIDNKNGLKTYKNEEYGYIFNYPGDWAIEDHYNMKESSLGGDMTVKYVKLSTPDKLFSIYIGIKGSEEDKFVLLNPYYSGIPAGNFYRGGEINILEGVAEKLILDFGEESYSDYVQTDNFDSSKSSNVRLIFYCNPSQDKKVGACDNFYVGRDKVAKVEIRCIEEECYDYSLWENIQIQTEKVLKSLIFLE